MTLDRSSLRQLLRQRRRDLSDTEQQQAALNSLEQFKYQLSQYTVEPRRIALYLSNDGELSPEHICAWCWDQNIEVYLPILNGKALLFGRYSKDTQWTTNTFGIQEPIDANPISGAELDWVLLPLVGFDSFGGRIGMGGGFYDRTFENIDRKKTRLIGLAHDCQEVEKLPIESWDVPLSAIITATRCIHVD